MSQVIAGHHSTTPFTRIGGVMVDHYSPVPLYVQVYELLKQRIASGDIPVGRPIPSKRTLTQELGVASNTVQHAIEMLQAEGVLQTVRGKGLYVKDRPA